MVRHTEWTVLSAATRASFAGHIADLLRNGHKGEAHRLWDEVFEIVHKPWPQQYPLDVEGMPPIRMLVCTVESCERCLSGRGGFVFPFLGPWCRRRVVVTPGDAPSAAWDSLAANTEHMDLLLLEIYGSRWEVQDFCPRIWDRALELVVDGPGCASRDSVRQEWRKWQLGTHLWRDPGQMEVPSLAQGRENTLRKAHRSIMGWLAHVSDGETSGLPLSCGWCGALTRHACPFCLQGLCIHCDRECPTFLCCNEIQATGGRRFTFPEVQPGQPRGDLLGQLHGAEGLPPVARRRFQ